MDALWTETERRWKTIFICEQLIQRQQRKGFCRDWRWEIDILRQPQEEKILSQSLPISTPTPQTFEDHALYLMGSKRSCLLWAAETWRFHYERSVSATINSFEPCIARKPEYKQRHDKIILLHDNARPHVAKVVKKYLETLKWDVLSHPLYSPDIAPSNYWLFRRMQQVTGSLLSQKSKIGSKIGSPPFFRDEIWKLPERWEKVVGSDGQYFNWSVHSFCFEINAQKNRSN